MKNKHSANRKSIRHFLLLQGPKSPFFAQLAKQIRAENCKVTKINFDAVDKLFFGSEAIDYTYPKSQWASYVSDIAKIRGVTDLVVFDDKNTMHADAIARLKDDGVNIHVFANGYFDSEHITLEKMGANANSQMPREPMFYMRTPTIHSENMPRKFVGEGFFRNLYEISAAVVSKKLEHTFFPLGLVSFLKQKSLKTALHNKKYYVLSLSADEAHKAPEIVTSFEKHSKDEILLIHSPLKNWKSSKRVLHVAYAQLENLVKNATGMIVFGSADGIIALENEVPLLALDKTIFNFAGLTNQSKLLGFWYRRVPANPSLYGKFKNHVSAKTQINGGFYGKSAIASAAKIATKNMLSNGNFAVGNNVSENV